ncbi:MAG: hypothetical protein CL675_13410 [Bdellovibrionaceae bacterium]|nr:hypothetical protein [Pseudobdellovibrionaceae bacterium]
MMEYDDNSNAVGAAYTGEASYPRKPMKSHADWRPLLFYFKECTEVGQKFYYSKTAYDCLGPR